jgi:acetyl esterase/lipase
MFADGHFLTHVTDDSQPLTLVYSIFHASGPSSPVVIYLPSGPVLPNSIEEEEQVISILRETTSATIARINYRASAEHQYPTAFHDVLFGYDWIIDHLLRGEADRPHLARLGVCGELIGGSLATMLGLTECRADESRIFAGAVNNPIVDWVFPDELPSVDPSDLPEPLAPDETELPAESDPMDTRRTEPASPIPKSPKRSRKKHPPTSWQLYGDNSIIPTLTLSAERDVLFRKPEHYFDRFASPMHFFRSPHAQMIMPEQDDMYASRQPIEPLDPDIQMSLDHYAAVSNEAEAPELPYLARCRAYARIYPPGGTDLKLPHWHVTTGDESPLLDQATELTKMLRRSVARQMLRSYAGRTRWQDEAEKQMYGERALERVQLDTSTGLGLWTEHQDGQDGQKSLRAVGAWMKERLENSFN